MYRRIVSVLGGVPVLDDDYILIVYTILYVYFLLSLNVCSRRQRTHSTQQKCRDDGKKHQHPQSVYPLLGVFFLDVQQIVAALRTIPALVQQVKHL